MEKKMARSFPWEHVFSFIHADEDRNAVSMVCKSWYEIERFCRRKVFVGNCYAVSPAAVVRRFPEVRSLELKGKPHFADFNLVPDGWGGYLYPWIQTMSTAYTSLEEIRLKRMVVADETLELIVTSFTNLSVLVLSSCEGFSTDGLAAIAANCRNLKELDLRESEVDELSGQWLSHFPDTYTSLVSLNISCLSSDIDFSALELLVSRNPNLKSLSLNRAVPLEILASLLQHAPQLVELGTCAFTAEQSSDVLSTLSKAFQACEGLKNLSGFWDANPAYLPSLYPVCSRLTTLNLSYATVERSDLVELLIQCPQLQRLWVLDHIEDSGLEAIASSCKELQELRVFPSDPCGTEPNASLTEQGLVSVSAGCRKLESVLYFCRQMTNTALIEIARNCPNLTRFRLCIMEPKTPDYSTQQPLDIGFGAIVEHCKDLRRLSLSGLLTDKVFQYIGTHAKKLEILSVAFAGDSDLGLHHVLSGCESLRKLEIRDCPFGDKALLTNAAKLEKMRFLWMSSCSVGFEACRLLGQKMPRLNVEVIDEGESWESKQEECIVETLYVYRTLAGPRSDMPEFVRNMAKD